MDALRRSVRSERGGGKGGEEPSRLGGKGRGRRPHHAARGHSGGKTKRMKRAS